MVNTYLNTCIENSRTDARGGRRRTGHRAVAVRTLNSHHHHLQSRVSWLYEKRSFAPRAFPYTLRRCRRCQRVLNITKRTHADAKTSASTTTPHHRSTALNLRERCWTYMFLGKAAGATCHKASHKRFGTILYTKTSRSECGTQMRDFVCA